MIETYGYMKDIQMSLRHTKAELPIHVILGRSNYVKIKIQKCLRVDRINEPIAEQTKMGWAIMSPGREDELFSSLYTRTSVSDFDRLCDIDVLGVEENQMRISKKKIKQKLERNGWLVRNMSCVD